MAGGKSDLLKEIAIDDIVRDLGAIAKLGVDVVRPVVSEELLSSVAIEGRILRETDPKTAEIRKLLTAYSFCLTDAGRERLASTPIFHLDYGGFLAFSSLHRGQPYVVVSAGVLHAATYRLALAVLTDRLLRVLPDRASDPDELRFMLGLTVTKARDLSIASWEDLSKLPRIAHVFDPANSQQFIDGVLGCLTFIAMHEIGHLELGHLSCRKCEAGERELIAPEALNEEKHQEFEADLFAFEAVKAEHRVSFSTNMLIAFDLYMDMERALPVGSSHPRTVNRIDGIARAVDAYDEAFFAKHIASMLEQRIRELERATGSSLTSLEDGVAAVELLLQLYGNNCT